MSINYKTKNLLIFAHPDDEILGAGGYITKHSKNQLFKVIFIGEGSSIRFILDTLLGLNLSLMSLPYSSE